MILIARRAWVNIDAVVWVDSKSGGCDGERLVECVETGR